jgi:CheY-like chemotaxis protein
MPERAVILLAEDSEDDVLLIKHAFAKANILNPLFVVRDGEEAILYLKGEGKFGNREEFPLPDLFLLDLQMPRINGFEVLKWVKQQPGLSALRILVLTSSEALRDVNGAYHLGANSFLVKPHDFQDFVGMGAIIQEFWLRRSKAPQISRTKPSDEPRGNGNKMQN